MGTENEITLEMIEALGKVVEDNPPQASALDQFKQEMAQYITEMKSLKQMHPDQGMGWLSSVSARVLEMIFLTLESESRAATKFRVERLIPLRDELRYQYQIASRRISAERFEWEVAGGQEI